MSALRDIGILLACVAGGVGGGGLLAILEGML